MSFGRISCDGDFNVSKILPPLNGSLFAELIDPQRTKLMEAKITNNISPLFHPEPMTLNKEYLSKFFGI